MFSLKSRHRIFRKGFLKSTQERERERIVQLSNDIKKAYYNLTRAFKQYFKQLKTNKMSFQSKQLQNIISK